ncbi:CAP domain-containing protein [Kineosporia sp. NBRC 101731]|uniref:CAP domain-containing protein n=1 Tax=Kineosporia sp. NBRC 101731 TaxID=3032199 RepID=UPI002552A48A|nr:CAP domain-containing protein [Kineosporia sp. NBRC 101731]
MALTRHQKIRKLRPVLIAGVTAVVVGGTGAAFACTPWAGNGSAANASPISGKTRTTPSASATTEPGTDTPTSRATSPDAQEVRQNRRRGHRGHHGKPTASPTQTPTSPADNPSTPPADPTTDPDETTPAPSGTTSTSPTTTAPTGGSGDSQVAKYQAEVLALTNAERAAAGCDVKLTANAALTKAAQAHAEDMLKNNYFSHDSQNGTGAFERITAAGYTWSGAAENIAAGQATPAAVMKSWMNSAGHKANILNCSLTELGVGYAAGSGAAYGQYWVQDFGTPRK